jgi:energy-coupling factor transporter ATP-binding protein EcfA2
MEPRKKALERGWPGPAGGRLVPEGNAAELVRLGLNPRDGQAFDLSVAEIAQHIFLPGASGSGKTTTVACLMDGLLSHGYGVAVIDCKGSGLGDTARVLARRHEVALNIVDPKDSATLGYDPCSGDAAAIANKIVGAFTFSGEAEIYKQVAMEVVPVLCRAMESAGVKVTLAGLYDSLNKGAMSRLGRRDGVEPYVRARLEQLEESGGVGAAGYVGLQRRLGALLEGAFGHLFELEPALRWSEVTRRPAVTHIALSATAAGEDVELFGRVITQDLKQLCDERMRAIDKGVDVWPLLIVYDEFAALREATQVVDLLLQARQARTPVLVATQYLPEEVSIRKPVLSAGVVIAHRLEADDAEIVASQFGTHTTPMLTAQVDYDTGESRMGSLRMVEEFDVHPNVFKSLPVGTAAVMSRTSGRKSVVSIQRVI